MTNQTDPVSAIPNVSILSIDAWRNGSGWDWNQWFKVGECPLDVAELTPRKLLKYMRDNGYLSDKSVGKVAIDDDQYNVVIIEKSTRMPLFAIAYGEVG